MNRDLQTLLSLDDLVLMRRGLKLAAADGAQPDSEILDQRINRLRRQVPGRVLSLYDHLSRRYPDVVTTIVGGVCQGCHAEISSRLAAEAAQSEGIVQCEHCGRLIVNQRQVPDFVN
jgi:predicted  nucleic acid-binding Zn-ribbon protein